MINKKVALPLRARNSALYTPYFLILEAEAYLYTKNTKISNSKYVTMKSNEQAKKSKISNIIIKIAFKREDFILVFLEILYVESKKSIPKIQKTSFNIKELKS